MLVNKDLNTISTSNKDKRPAILDPEPVEPEILEEDKHFKEHPFKNLVMNGVTHEINFLGSKL